jgi:hypothetical protein
MNELWQSSEREGSMRFALLKRASAVRRISNPLRLICWLRYTPSGFADTKS